MKRLIFTILTLLSPLSFSQALEEAREVKIAQMTYNESSLNGQIRIDECNRCSYKLYTFGSNLVVEKNSQISTVNTLLEEYWDTNIAVIFIKPNTNELTRISYRKQGAEK
jgi:hypothetical protein